MTITTSSRARPAEGADEHGLVLPSSAPDLIAPELLDSIAELRSLGRAAAWHRISQAGDYLADGVSGPSR